MGGGGVMRTAARVTGVGGVIHRGLRGPQPAPSGEHRFSASARDAAFPVSATLSSSSALIGAAEPVVQRSIGDSDDWVFASGEGELNSGTDSPSPRLVFAGVPTLEEAKSATSDLKDALEKFAAPLAVDRESDSDLKTSTTITKKSMPPSLQNPAVQAFKLLQENSGAQTVVASLACDQHVWDAVLKNEALRDFLQSQQSDVEDGESVADNGANSCGESLHPKGGSGWSGFCRCMENLKVSVVEMMNKASVENLKVSVVEMMNKAFDLWRNTAARLGGEERFNAKDSSMPMTLMALVVAVIMLVLFKRV